MWVTLRLCTNDAKIGYTYNVGSWFYCLVCDNLIQYCKAYFGVIYAKVKRSFTQTNESYDTLWSKLRQITLNNIESWSQSYRSDFFEATKILLWC